jgi:hypothetical protein
MFRSRPNGTCDERWRTVHRNLPPEALHVNRDTMTAHRVMWVQQPQRPPTMGGFCFGCLKLTPHEHLTGYRTALRAVTIVRGVP